VALSEPGKRVAVAVVGIPVAVGAVYAGGLVLGGLLALIAVLAALEFYRMAERKAARPLALLGAGAAGAMVLLAATFPDLGPGRAGVGWLLALYLLAVLTASIWARGVEGEPLLSASVAVFGTLYTGGLLSYALYLRHLPHVLTPWHGTALLFAPVLLTWVSDTFAYFVGRAWGRRKLIPRVSPGKTVEGSLGALAGSVGVAVGYAWVLGRFPTYRMTLPEAALLGVLVSVSAQVGDLAESLLKRDAGVKDSGTLLPGHGGALDRFDSLFFTLPLAYLFFRFIVGIGE
jgi:phosphatidate cytidylyltransferase